MGEGFDASAKILSDTFCAAALANSSASIPGRKCSFFIVTALEPKTPNFANPWIFLCGNGRLVCNGVGTGVLCGNGRPVWERASCVGTGVLCGNGRPVWERASC